MTLTPRRLLAAAAAGVALLATMPSAAQAASPPYLVDLTNTHLVLNPTERGYTGTMSFTVKWQGTQPNGSLSVSIVEPIAGAWRSIDPESACWFNYGDDMRRTIGCGLEGGFQPGQEVTYTLAFTALTPAQVEPMVAIGGQLSVVDGVSGSTVSPVRKFAATLRGTNGSIKNPTPYVQDTSTDIMLTAASSVMLTRQEDGTFLGRLPMTVIWHGDAPNYGASIEVPLPDGWYTPDTDPSSENPCWQGCSAPGGEFMDGDVRSFDMLIHAPEDAVVGSTGTITARAGAYWGYGELLEVSPEDNTVTFTYTIA
jgi:hypothetical protein